MLFPQLTGTQIRLIAAAFCAVFTLINLVSVGHAGRLQVVMVLGLLAILAVYCVVGLGSVDLARFEPFLPEGWGGLLATTGLVFVSFGGLTKAVSVAEEVRDPARNLPLGMFLAFVVVVSLYAATTFVTVGVVEAAALRDSLTPINLGAASSMGRTGVIVIAVAAVLAFVSTANAGIMAASRIPLAMARDRLLPGLFERVHPERGVPSAGILATGAFMCAAILFLELETLVKVASTLKLLLFVLVCVAVILMRESRIESYRPSFRSPFYPWLQIAGIIGYCVLIAAMGTLPLVLSCVFVVISLVWYAAYGRRSDVSNGDSAVIHVVQRIANRDLADRSLGGELKRILRERDGIQEDRFDRLVASCQILEIEGASSLESFMRQAADALADEADMTAGELYDHLLERERDTSTAISAELAVPHAVVPGAGRFHILIARSADGVAFSEHAEHVKAIFVLLGSADERNFHLRCLMAIAETAQEPDFHERWQRAQSAEDLRDLVLLSTRRRQAD